MKPLPVGLLSSDVTFRLPVHSINTGVKKGPSPSSSEKVVQIWVVYVWDKEKISGLDKHERYYHDFLPAVSHMCQYENTTWSFSRTSPSFLQPKLSLQKPLSLTLFQEFTSFRGDFATSKSVSEAPRNPLVLGRPILPVWRNAVGQGQGVFSNLQHDWNICAGV